jgi:hypothetical protein
LWGSKRIFLNAKTSHIFTDQEIKILVAHEQYHFTKLHNEKKTLLIAVYLTATAFFLSFLITPLQIVGTALIFVIMKSIYEAVLKSVSHNWEYKADKYAVTKLQLTSTKCFTCVGNACSNKICERAILDMYRKFEYLRETDTHPSICNREFNLQK